MSKIFESIDKKLASWIKAQALFFVATAPLSAKGHVNVSPKGPIASLRILDEHTVAYLDTLGSGAETIAHLRENGRIVVMLCAFAGPPRIVRLHGLGKIVRPRTRQFTELMARCKFADLGIAESRRAIVLVRVKRVADSCGYGVPLMTFRGPRPHMREWATKKLRDRGPGVFRHYERLKNAVSIDGLPALAPKRRTGARPARKRSSG